MKKKYVFLFCLISLLSLTLLINAAEQSELQIKDEKCLDLAKEVANYKNQLAEINFQNKKLFFEEKLTDTKKNDFISSLENIKIQMKDDLFPRTLEFKNEIKVLLDSGLTDLNNNDYKNYIDLWHNVSNLASAEMKLISVSFDQIFLITGQSNMNTIERELYNEMISIKLDFASLRWDLALR